MKNKFNFGLILAITVFIALGCSRISDQVQKSVSDDNSAANSSNDNKSIIDRTTESIVDGETTGVPECDEVLRIIADQSKNPDDNWMTKTGKDFVLGQIKKSVRESIKENKNDQEKMAAQCRDFKKDLEKNIREEENKKK